MRTLIIADIHANMVALEAVLASPQAQSCQRIISLGDQVNFGPQPRQVLQRLRELGAMMLLGNHEERLLHMNDAAFSAYNWVLLHWTHRQLAGFELHLPTDLREGCCLFTHGTPGDPYHLLHDEDLPAQLDALPEGVTHLFSGHNHKPWFVQHGGKTACNPGSLGMLEDNAGGTAPFAVLEDRDGRLIIERHAVPYNLQAVKRAFLQSGCVQAAPEMSRIVLHTILTGEQHYVLKMMRYITSVAEPLGLTLGDHEAWQAADFTLPWQEKIPTQLYWQRLEEELTC